MSLTYRNAHLNLVDSSRRLFELDPAASLEVGGGWLFGAGSSPHPAISNAAFRTDDGVDPGEFLERAFAFFGERGRGFSVWVRGDEPEDRGLVEAADAAGLRNIHESPEMVISKPVQARPLPEEAELRRLGSKGDAEDFWRVAEASYADIGFPAEVFAHYDDHTGLLADHVVPFLAYLDGEPVAISMTIVSHGVAGIYWVGSLEAARGKGLGWAVTAAATNAGFGLGADVASLQASSMGAPMYLKMGYEAIYDYRLLMAAPPKDGR